MDANFHGICQHTFPPANDALDGRTHFLQTGAENSTTHFLLLAFMVSWMAAVPTLYIHLKKEHTGEEKRNNINSFAQPIGKNTGTRNQ